MNEIGAIVTSYILAGIIIGCVVYFFRNWRR